MVFVSLLATKLGFVDQKWLKPRTVGAVQRFGAPEPHLIAMGTQVVLIGLEGVEEQISPGPNPGSRMSLLAMLNTTVVKSGSTSGNSYNYGYDSYLDFPINKPLYKTFTKNNLRSLKLTILNQYHEAIEFRHQPYQPALITVHIKEAIQFP